jgi:hypothetical protein
VARFPQRSQATSAAAAALQERDCAPGQQQAERADLQRLCEARPCNADLSVREVARGQIVIDGARLHQREEHWFSGETTITSARHADVPMVLPIRMLATTGADGMLVCAQHSFAG